MDESKFDAIARSLGKGITRRNALKGLAAGAAGGLFARFTVETAEARDFQVCHDGQTVTVTQQELNLRLRQGDTLRIDCCGDADCASSMGQCGQGVCQNGYCVTLPKPEGTPCASGSFCTADGRCDGAGSCGAGGAVECEATGNPCTTAVCSEAAQGCVEIPLENGFACGTRDACVSHICMSGMCVSQHLTDCTGTCADCSGECVDLHGDLDNCGACGHACEDLGKCFTTTCTESGTDGVCLNTPVACPAGDQCHIAGCDPDTGCYLQPNTGASCATAGGNSGTCGSNGVCHPICPGTATCSTTEDCGANQVCWNGGCFTSCSGPVFCSTECANCYCSIPPSFDQNARICADIDFYVGYCADNTDCPSGSYCNPNLFSGDSEKRFLCTRPCSRPAAA